MFYEDIYHIVHFKWIKLLCFGAYSLEHGDFSFSIRNFFFPCNMLALSFIILGRDRRNK